MNHVWTRYDALLLKKKEVSWNDWYFQFILVFEILLWSARLNKLHWDYFWRRNISFMNFDISHSWKYIDMYQILNNLVIRISLELIWGIRHTFASVIHNYCKIRTNDTFVLLHFCTTTTVIYFKSVRSHHGGHKLLHGILCNILFLKKSFFENI